MAGMLGRTAGGIVLLVLGVLTGCAENDAPDDIPDPMRAPEIARIAIAEEALAGAHIPTLHPATMNDAEIRKALGAGPLCEFRYSRGSRPVLAVSAHSGGVLAGGIVKVSGSLVPLTPAPVDPAAKPRTFLLVAGPIRLALSPDPGGPTGDPGAPFRDANMVFEVGQSLRTGYRGYFGCRRQPAAKSPGR